MLTAEFRYRGPLFDGEAERIVEEELRRALVELTMYGEAVVKRNTPVGVTGQARNSIHATPPRTGAGGEIEATITSNVGYIVPLELGLPVTPGGPTPFPPPQNLVLWVQRRLGVPPEEALRVAFLVAGKIKRYGMRGARMFEKGHKAIMDALPGHEVRLGQRISARLGGI